MPRAEKEERVRGLAERLSAASAAVLTDYRGLSVKDAAELRAALAEVDARFSIVKNTLTKLAVKEAGLEGLAEFVDGPTAIAFILGDPVAGAKRLVGEARRLPFLEVRGGFAEGRILSADQIRQLASLESREVMLARIAGLGKVQLSRTAWILQALQAKFLLALRALSEKQPQEAEAQPAEEPAGEEERPAEMPEAPSEAEPGPAETETEPGPEPEAPAEEPEAPAEEPEAPAPEPEAPAEEPEAPAEPAETETEPTEGGA